jgi:ribosomal protein S18 acetylase RimI-like enzyme
MKLVRWVRFAWELNNIPEEEVALEPHYRIRRAVHEDAAVVHDVLISSFTLDNDWNDTLHKLRELFQVQIEETFAHRDEIPCLVLTRGSRIVGASLLSFDPADANHLISGPAIVNEYQNRGLGAALLQESLRTLRLGGLDRAFGVTKLNAPTAKFLYTKFNSVHAPFDFETELARAGS